VAAGEVPDSAGETNSIRKVIVDFDDSSPLSPTRQNQRVKERPSRML
jgi:hypothetical protein